MRDEFIKLLAETAEISGGTAATALGAVWLCLRYFRSPPADAFDKERTELLALIADLRRENEELRKAK